MDQIDAEDLGNREVAERLFLLAKKGDPEASAALVERYRLQLKRLICVRIDPRVAQRFDDSDVIQDLTIRLMQGRKGLDVDEESCVSKDDIQDKQGESPYLWLRRLALWTLGDLQRKQLGVQRRDPRREISLNDFLGQRSSCFELARMLAGSETRPIDAIVRIERERALEIALQEMPPIDREILMLRHGEQLSRIETAQVLRISVAAAAKRYTRALNNIRQVLKEWES